MCFDLTGDIKLFIQQSPNCTINYDTMNCILVCEIESFCDQKSKVHSLILCILPLLLYNLIMMRCTTMTFREIQSVPLRSVLKFLLEMNVLISFNLIDGKLQCQYAKLFSRITTLNSTFAQEFLYL